MRAIYVNLLYTADVHVPEQQWHADNTDLTDDTHRLTIVEPCSVSVGNHQTCRV